MFYLAIDQHSKQLTVNLRDEDGEVCLRRQVSTSPERVRAFFEMLSERTSADQGYVAIVEICGFNDWLLAMLAEPWTKCREVVLVQPEKRGKQKTDRRDANKLGETLWVNRHRLLAGKPAILIRACLQGRHHVCRQAAQSGQVMVRPEPGNLPKIACGKGQAISLVGNLGGSVQAGNGQGCFGLALPVVESLSGEYGPGTAGHRPPESRSFRSADEEFKAIARCDAVICQVDYQQVLAQANHRETVDELKANWHRFRGFQGAGVSTFADPPRQWDVAGGAGMVWKTVVPLPGKNSPVVWQDRVLFGSADGHVDRSV